MTCIFNMPTDDRTPLSIAQALCEISKQSPHPSLRKRADKNRTQKNNNKNNKKRSKNIKSPEPSVFG